MKSLVFSTLLAVVPATAFVAPVAADVPQQGHDRDFHHEHYDRWNDSHWARDFHGRWQVLGRGFNARNDRQPINLSGRFHKLRLEAVRGEPRINRIAIHFADGTSQTVDVDAQLSTGAGEVIDLDNAGDRRIRRIVVFAEPSTRGVYSVFAG
jgi:hypothetical protein